MCKNHITFSIRKHKNSISSKSLVVKDFTKLTSAQRAPIASVQILIKKLNC
jgi:hypothetical protein